jgi:hypothetical protein
MNMKNQVKQNPELWKKISEFSLDAPDASFSFTKRLCRENGWNENYAKRVIDEYKKFLYLSCIAGRSLTPSDEVDQAWHLHMIYTESYWTDLCQNTLGRKFGHGPTKGGKAEGEKYSDQYQFTLDLYKEIFGLNAPSDIWPDAKTRFANVVFKRVNMHENIVLSKKKVKEHMMSYALLLIGVFLLGTLTSSKSESSEIDWGTVFMWIGIGLAVIFIIRGIIRYINRNDRNGGSSGSSGSSSSSDGGCTIAGSFFGCGSSGCSSSSSGCGSSGCGSSGCGGGGCGGGGCGGCGG